jgi:hypothetical protein
VDAYARWADAHADLATTLPTAKTSRGYHVYFRADGLPDRVDKYADGELRGGNGYVVLPPSAHPDGGRYEWVITPGAAIPVISDPAAVGLVGPAPAATAAAVEVPPAVDEAIKKTLPTRYGQRNDKVFQFARRLKAIKGLDTRFDAMQGYIKAWHQQALSFIKSKEFYVTEETFFNAWRDAKTPLADDQFRTLVNDALAAPDPPWYAHLLLSEGARKLLKVCIALQAFHQEKPFYLSARTAAAVINVDQTHANRMLNGLAKAEYLKVVKKGTLADMLGTEWNYTGKQG